VVVGGTLVAGVVDAGVEGVGVGVPVGATVPGWAPLVGAAVVGVVGVGVVEVGVVDVGVVVAEAGVFDVAPVWTRAEAGIGTPKIESVWLGVLAAEAAPG